MVLSGSYDVLDLTTREQWRIGDRRRGFRTNRFRGQRHNPD